MGGRAVLELRSLSALMPITHASMQTSQYATHGRGGMHDREGAKLVHGAVHSRPQPLPTALDLGLQYPGVANQAGGGQHVRLMHDPVHALAAGLRSAARVAAAAADAVAGAEAAPCKGVIKVVVLGVEVRLGVVVVGHGGAEEVGMVHVVVVMAWHVLRVWLKLP